MGIFMLEMLFLAFTSVSALPLFWLERPLYAYEHANGYYGPGSYFTAKVRREGGRVELLPNV
jgi:hypothetical protein